MNSARLKTYGIAVGLAVVTASGIVAATVLVLGMAMAQCGPGSGGADCLPAPEATAAAVVPQTDTGSAAPGTGLTPERLATAQPIPEMQLEPLWDQLPRSEDSAEAEITTASITVDPARPTAERAATSPRTMVVVPAANAALAPAARTATDIAALEKPEAEALPPFKRQESAAAPEAVQEEKAAPAVASELSVVPSDTISIAGDWVNVRAAASPSAKRLFVFRQGTAVTASEQSRGWVKIADAKGRGGWVDASLLANVDLTLLPEVAPQQEDVAAAPGETAETAQPTSASTTRTIAGAGANVRSGPSSDAGKLFALTGGTRVEITGEDKGWLQIVDPRGRSGWVYSSLLD